MIHRYILPLPMNQRMLNKSRRKDNKTDQKYADELLLVRHILKNMSYREAIGKLVVTVKADSLSF